MTGEQKKKYEEDIKGCGNLDYPLAGCILTPFCQICKNYHRNKNPYIPSTCKALGAIPDELINCKKYECDYFIHDPDNVNNKAFDENLQPIYK